MSADFLAEAAARWPRRPALTDTNRTWSYAELDDWASDIAARIHGEDGPGEGDVVAVTMEPEPAGVAFLLAAWRAGLTVAPLSPLLTDAEHQVALKALTGVRPEGHAVLWTSGTSGRPRGVVLSADGLRASAVAAAERLSLGPDDRWLASLSVAHIGGLAMVTRSVLLGSELIAVGSFDIDVASTLVDDGLVTHMSLVPTQLLRLLDARAGRPAPTSLRCVLVGGAHASEELVRRALEARWPLALTYGMTEMTSQVATAPPALVRRKPGTVGAPLSGVELAFSPEGEILLRGPGQAIGFVGVTTPVADGEGWYRSGDLGELDDEGHLRITGRASERLVTGGVTVDPLEVEAALRSHPAILDVCVVGIPDPEWGDKVAAAVVPVEGEFDPETVDAWARERLSPPKRPRRWLLVDTLPVNRNGKVDRGAVRSMVLGH